MCECPEEGHLNPWTACGCKRTQIEEMLTSRLMREKRKVGRSTGEIQGGQVSGQSVLQERTVGRCGWREGG